MTARIVAIAAPDPFDLSPLTLPRIGTGPPPPVAGRHTTLLDAELAAITGSISWPAKRYSRWTTSEIVIHATSRPRRNRADTDAAPDAVIVIPGMMGSELVDTDSGEILWGRPNLHWYVNVWTSDEPTKRLRLNDEERGGRAGRVRASRLLRVPAFAPVLRGIESYTPLVNLIRDTCPHPDAVLEFPYDWRLSVARNARLLAGVAAEHMDRWRRHPYGSSEAR